MVQKVLSRAGLISGTVLAWALPALAALNTGNEPRNILRFEDLGETIQTIFNVVIILAGVIFVILFLVGGIQYLTAAGNEEQTGKAKRLLVDAIVGLVIVLAAWAIANFVLDQLGLNIETSSGGPTVTASPQENR
jgi:TRAP-type C4-dicarboxylate transport system permease small subunit